MKKVLYIVFCCLAFIALAKEVKINLSPDHTAFGIVDFKQAAKNYSIQLTFLPVKTLDSVTNSEMTLVLSRFYAQESLSAFIKKNVSINFDDCSFRILQNNKDLFKCTYSVPAEAIGAEKKKNLQDDGKTFNKVLSSDDIEEEMLMTRSQTYRDLKAINIYYMSFIHGKRAKGLEAKIRSTFRQLIKKIEEDESLFISEKDSVKEKAMAIEEQLLTEMRENYNE